MLRHLPLDALHMSPGEVFDKSEPTDWSIWQSKRAQTATHNSSQQLISLSLEQEIFARAAKRPEAGTDPVAF
jgi:hypothetical protein